MRRINVPVTDRSFAGARVYYLAGPLKLRTVESIERVFHQLSECGAENRLGLHPSRRSNRWAFGSARTPSWIVTAGEQLHEPVAIDDELVTFAATEHNAPIVVSVRGDYLLYSYDHGLGDGHFATEIPALLSSDETTTVGQWPRVTTKRPTSTAVRRALQADPRSLGLGIRGLLSSGGPPQPQICGRFESKPQVVSGSSERGWVDDVRELRVPGETAGVFAMILMAFIRALRHHGIDVQDFTGVMVDLRRYLPTAGFTLSNFVSIVQVPTDPAATSLEIENTLKDTLDSYQPLVRHLASSAKIKLKGTVDLGPWEVKSPRRARVVFTEGAARSALAKFNWVESSAPRIATGSLPLTFSDQISVFLSRLPDGAISLVSTFFDGEHDPDTIRAAVRDVLDDPAAHRELWAATAHRQ